MDSPDQSFFSKVLPFLQGFDQLGLIVAFCALCDLHLSKAKQFRREIRVNERSDHTPIRPTQQNLVKKGKEEADHCHGCHTITDITPSLHYYSSYTVTVLTPRQSLNWYSSYTIISPYTITILTLLQSLYYYSS